MFERILVALDGTKESEAVLGDLAFLPAIQDAQFFLFHAIPIPMQDGIQAGLLLAESRGEAEKYLTGVESGLRERGLKALKIVRLGGEAGGILDAARQHRVCLIAMSTHGRRGLPRFMHGSVAETVLRGSTVPVFAVHAHPGTSQGQAHEAHVRRILMPVDSSEGSLAILPHVRELAASVGASVTVLGVVEPRGSEAAGVGDPLVRLAVNRLAQDQIPVDPLVRLGDPASEILAASLRHHADLIAMSTHGRRGVSRWVNGSVTERVLRDSPVPVLTLREPA